MIAILDDNRDSLDSTVQSILALGYEPAGFSSPIALLSYLNDQPVQLLIIGEPASRNAETMRLLSRYRERHAKLPVIAINPGFDCAAEGFHILDHPFTQSTLDRSITSALQQTESQAEF